MLACPVQLGAEQDDGMVVGLVRCEMTYLV